MGGILKRWRQLGPGVRLGAALVLLGVLAFVFAASVSTEPTAEISNDEPVNEGARSRGDISANNSPTVARNPRRPGNLAVANRIDSPDYSCALHVSTDGGDAWRDVKVPLPRGERKCYAPDVVFTGDGRLHMSFVTLRGRGNVPNAVWLVSSRDGGRTLSRPRKVVGGLPFQVRLTADPNDPRRLYLAWLRAADVGLLRFTEPGNPIVVARSEDGGATWGRPVRVNAPNRGRVVAPTPAVGPNGEVYVLFLDLGGDRLDYEGLHEGRGGPPYRGRFRLVLSRSTDRGANWAESEVDTRIVPTERFVAFLPPFPALAVDQDSGRVYAGFQDGRFGKADVLVWSLASGANDWNGPTRVNDTSKDDRTSQYLPRIDVAPDGRVDVVYYDRRSDRLDRLNEVSLQSSFDDGESFKTNVLLTSEQFDSHIGSGSERNMPDLGSRLGVVSEDDSALAVWSDTRAGTVDSNKQDIGSARVDFSEASGATRAGKYVLRYGGVLLALAGIALVVTPRLRSMTAA